MPDPKEVLTRLKDKVLPEIEQYCKDLLVNLLECYSERVNESAPLLSDAIDEVVAVIEGDKSLAAAALDFLKQDLLPKLQDKATELIEPIEAKVQAKLEGVTATVNQAKDQAIETGGQILEQAGISMNNRPDRTRSG